MCSAEQTTISNSMNQNDYFKWIGTSTTRPDNELSFSPFTCDPEACCKLSRVLDYKLTSWNTLPTNSLTPWTVEGMQSSISNRNGNLTAVPEPTINVGSITFYIYAVNGWGTEYISQKAMISVACDPGSAQISLTDFPDGLGNVQNLPV
jgi:hypothetical protein